MKRERREDIRYVGSELRGISRLLNKLVKVHMKRKRRWIIRDEKLAKYYKKFADREALSASRYCSKHSVTALFNFWSPDE